MQEKTRRIRDGLGASLGGLFTSYLWALKCKCDLTGTDRYVSDVLLLHQEYDRCRLQMQEGCWTKKYI